MVRKLFALILILLLTGLAAAAPAEGFRQGDWAFIHAPEESVLLVREDGTAVFSGQDYAWTDDGVFLRLTDAAGEQLQLRYRIGEDKVLLYLPKVYKRVADVPGTGLAGAWTGLEDDGSSFIFREEDHQFLEDGTFTGTWKADEEAGTFLLVYPRYFDDTLCYYTMEGDDTLTVEYPWPITETE